jgi:hypothetical protein
MQDGIEPIENNNEGTQNLSLAQDDLSFFSFACIYMST